MRRRRRPRPPSPRPGVLASRGRSRSRTEPAATEPAATGPSEESWHAPPPPHHRHHQPRPRILPTDQPTRSPCPASTRVSCTFIPGTFEVVNQLAETFTPSADGLSVRRSNSRRASSSTAATARSPQRTSSSPTSASPGLTKPKIEAAYRGDWSPHLEEVRVTDTYSGTIVLKEPFAPILRSTLPVGSGLVVSKKAVEERGEEYPTHPIGTGPYEFVSGRRSKRLCRKPSPTTAAQPRSTVGTSLRRRSTSSRSRTTSASDIALQAGEIDFAQLALQGIDRFLGRRLPGREADERSTTTGSA